MKALKMISNKDMENIHLETLKDLSEENKKIVSNYMISIAIKIISLTSNKNLNKLLKKVK